MKNLLLSAPLLGAVLLAAPLALAAATPAALLPRAAGDLAADALARSAAPTSAATERAPVQFAWALDQSADDLDARPAPHRSESRAHWFRADARALAAGVALAIDEPGALIKLSPQSGARLDLAALELVDARGRVHPGASALISQTDPEHLKAAGMAFSAGTAIFNLDPALGAGEFTLRARLPGKEQLVVYVLERDSDVVLSLAPVADVVFDGQRVAVEARLQQGATRLLGASKIRGELVAPDGHRQPISLARGRDGVYRGSLTADARPAAPGALWSLEVHAEARTARGAAVRRSVTAAVALSVPTARLVGTARIEALGAGGVRTRLDVESAAPGRYAVSAVLYGTNREGALQPIAAGQSAAWIDGERGELALDFDATTLSASGMRAPFELRDLRLVDQGRMHLLHRQARGLTIARVPAP